MHSSCKSETTLPLGQVIQTELAIFSEALPFGQVSHVSRPTTPSANVPGPQAVCPLAEQRFPGEHGVQLPLPLFPANLPTSHAEHVGPTLPLELIANPIAQAVQAVWPFAP